MAENPEGTTVYFHYDFDQKLRYHKVEFSDSFFGDFGSTELATLRAAHKRSISTQMGKVDVLSNAILNSNRFIREVLEKATLPECWWNPTPREDCPHSIFKESFSPRDAGVIDGLSEELTGVVILGTLILDYKHDIETQLRVNKALIEFEFKRAFENWKATKIEQYNGTEAEIDYQLHKDMVTLVSTFFTGGLAAASKGKKGADLITTVTDGFKTGVKGLIKSLDNITVKAVRDKIAKFTQEVQQKFFDDYFDEVSDVFKKAVDKKPELVDSWKRLEDANVSQALRSDPDKLTKVNRYLDNNPTKKDGFIDDLKNTFDPEKFVDKTSKVDDLDQQYGLDYDGFSPQNGKTKADLPQELYDDMLSGYSEGLPDHLKEQFLNQLIESGSNIPVKRTVSQGDELFKVIPKGNELTQSSYYVTKAQLDELKQLGDLEQKLGLPLGSHSVEYDVYKAVAKESVDIFESTVAPTLQKGYQTTGGATQSFILNSSKWEVTKVETIIP